MQPEHFGPGRPARALNRHRAAAVAATVTVALVLALPGAVSGAPLDHWSTSPEAPPVATFSIVGVDTVAWEWGVAVASRFLAVGAVVPWAEAGVGAIATQAIANTSFGPEGLALLRQGRDARSVMETLLTGDASRQIRQLGIVDAAGGTATFTGDRCQPWAGGIYGPGFVVQGNILANEEVALAMGQAFQNSTASLAERLLAALEAGDRAGGDSRGKQSAALLVVKARGGYAGGNDRFVDLRVDDDEDPVARLRRIYTRLAYTMLPTAHARLGDEALAAGDRERADREYSRVIDLYRDALAADAENPAPRNGLAWFYARHRVNLDEALHLALEAQRLEPDSWEVLDTLAEIHAARGDFEGALQYVERALEADPENAYLLGQVQRFRDAETAAQEGR